MDSVEPKKFFTVTKDSKLCSISIKAISPINIALVKYWGKLDEIQIIPANDSLSMTLDVADLCSTTEITLFDPKQVNFWGDKDELL